MEGGGKTGKGQTGKAIEAERKIGNARTGDARIYVPRDRRVPRLPRSNSTECLMFNRNRYRNTSLLRVFANRNALFLVRRTRFNDPRRVEIRETHGSTNSKVFRSEKLSAERGRVFVLFRNGLYYQLARCNVSLGGGNRFIFM